MKQAINVRGITKRFGNNVILKNMSMNIYEGEIYGFLGENGAGKTTLMKILLNLTKASSGEIVINGKKIEKDSYRYLRDIGSVVEYPVFYEGLTARENLQFHCSYMGAGSDNIDQVLAMTGMDVYEDRRVKECSLGMKQRLGIARAIVTHPKVLILDEPLNGLDPVGIRDIRMLLANLREKWEMTILISSHIVSEVENLADRVGILHRGKLAAVCDMKNIPSGSLEGYFLEQIGKGEKI